MYIFIFTVYIPDGGIVTLFTYQIESCAMAIWKKTYIYIERERERHFIYTWNPNDPACLYVFIGKGLVLKG